MFGNVKNLVLRETLDWGVHILIALILGYLIVNFVLQRTIVQEDSMRPTLFENDNLWVEKLRWVDSDWEKWKFGPSKPMELLTLFRKC